MSQVIHDMDSQEFYFDVPEVLLNHLGVAKVIYQLKLQGRCKLVYEKESDSLVDMWHTEVPVECRGRGYGKILANAAFEWAVSKKIKVKLSCSYLQKIDREAPKKGLIK